MAQQEQRSFDDIDAGSCNEFRVHGPPGVGKTTWMARQVARASNKYQPREILIASFTRAAAREIASRDGVDVAKENIGTLHSICYRSLHSPDIAEFKMPEWNSYAQEYAVSGAVKRDVDEPEYEATFATPGDAMFRKLQVFRAKCIERDHWPSDLVRFERKWADFKTQNNLIDFTDMIEVCLRDGVQSSGFAKVGFFDEAQDFSPLEIKLIRSWGPHFERFILAGDSDQCIYTFKGSSPHAFLEPEIPEDNNIVLGQSWRVPRKVHACAMRIIEQCTYRYPVQYAPRDDEGDVDRSAGSWSNVAVLMNAIDKDLARGDSVMILGTCAYMIDPIKTALRKAGMPFHNPWRKKRGDWNPLRYVDRVKAFLGPHPHAFTGAVARDWTGIELRKWGDILSARQVLTFGGKKRLLELANEYGEDPVPITELIDDVFEVDQLKKLLIMFEEEDVMPALRWLYENALAAKRKSLEYPANVIERHGADIIFEQPKIVIGTIHSVKGGEADIVYLFPDLSRGGMAQWNRGGEHRDAIHRVFYVGATRARKKLVICSPGSKMAVPIKAR